jgi:gliding motility-associated lipoprotein GldH
MNKLFHFLIVGLFLIIFWSCDTNRVYDEFKPVFESSWHLDSLMVFEIPVSDTLQNHNLYINIRNDINYEYSNLWLFINIEQPEGTSITDTFEMVLADTSGKWLGDGFGGKKTRQVLYRRNVFFPISGVYKVSIQQGMRKNSLEGITDVGFRVEKME